MLVKKDLQRSNGNYLFQMNGEKTKVRRTTAISTPTDVDERTVYVVS